MNSAIRAPRLTENSDGVEVALYEPATVMEMRTG
jgi:hypothetical protein